MQVDFSYCPHILLIFRERERTPRMNLRKQKKVTYTGFPDSVPFNFYGAVKSGDREWKERSDSRVKLPATAVIIRPPLDMESAESATVGTGLSPGAATPKSPTPLPQAADSSGEQLGNHDAEDSSSFIWSPKPFQSDWPVAAPVTPLYGFQERPVASSTPRPTMLSLLNNAEKKGGIKRFGAPLSFGRRTGIVRLGSSPIPRSKQQTSSGIVKNRRPWR